MKMQDFTSRNPALSPLNGAGLYAAVRTSIQSRSERSDTDTNMREVACACVHFEVNENQPFTRLHFVAIRSVSCQTFLLVINLRDSRFGIIAAILK